MGRAPCCDKANVKKGPWSPEEDARLKNFIATHGTGGNWITLPVKAGLRRCGKSCRLRWINYLRPDIKHGKFTEEEAATICRVYGEIGSRWSVIAQQLPGRTDNDIKNFWNTKLKKQLADRGIMLPSQRRMFPQNMGVGNYSGPAQIAPGGLLQQMLQQPDMPNYYPPPRPPDYQKWGRAFEGAGQFEVVGRSHPVQASPSVAKAEPYDFSQSLLASTTSQQYLHQDQRPWGAMRQSFLEEEEEEELKPASSLVRAQLEAMKIEPCQEGADVSRRAALDEVNRLVDEPVCQVTDEKINMLVSIQNEIQSFMEQPQDFCVPAKQTSPATVLSNVGRYRSPSSSCSDSVGGCNNGYDTELLSPFW